MKILNFDTYYYKTKKKAKNELEHYRLFMKALCKDLNINAHSNEILNGEFQQNVIYNEYKTLRSFCHQQYINYRLQFELDADVRCGNYEELNYPKGE